MARHRPSSKDSIPAGPDGSQSEGACLTLCASAEARADVLSADEAARQRLSADEHLDELQP